MDNFDIQVVVIRSEGDVNGFFTLIDSANLVRKTWSCDGGSLEPEDEGGYIITEEQHTRLFALWYSMTISPWPEEGEDHTCDYAVFDYKSGKCLMTWTAKN